MKAITVPQALMDTHEAPGDTAPGSPARQAAGRGRARRPLAEEVRK